MIRIARAPPGDLGISTSSPRHDALPKSDHRLSGTKEYSAGYYDPESTIDQAPERGSGPDHLGIMNPSIRYQQNL